MRWWGCISDWRRSCSCYTKKQMKAVTKELLHERLKQNRIGLRLRRELRFIPDATIDWSERDFIAITNKSRSEGVLVTDTKLVPFRLQRRSTGKNGRVAAIICDICATWQRGTYSVTITFPTTRGSVSYLCCDDLLCSLHVRDKTSAATLSRTQLRETNTAEDRVNRLRGRLKKMLESVG
jgi:hypothetical protein